ncbi:glycosyltransferase family 4 protein [Microbacterium stercoris]|uniref:Glycosyltransferase family 4 protein n=1 Tax=Microbacterium stercoris TaxID=2820289 RepID=A0A939QMJ3_9MICO|nr:glycosyltransferase family 4 protein [Microbacterium stercoris]MBO3664985.1 glycosyltransferase family 4 protein [Microbacterium stercoris]
MRILLLTTWYPTVAAPSSGIFVLKDAELLAREHDVQVVHLASPRLLSAEDEAVDRDRAVPVTRIPMSTTNPLQILAAARRIRPFLTDVDVLHTEAISTLLPLLAVGVRVPWVHVEHWSALSNPDTIGRARLALPVLRRLLRRPDVVTAVCDYLADPIRAHRPGPTRVVPCIVPQPETVAPHPGGAGPRLVAVGGLVERKDPITAVEALRLLHDAGLPASLHFVGDGPLRDAVRARADALGLGENVVLGGVRDQTGVEAELAAADLFLLPTKGENFCVSAAEAIVHGRPAVVGANGGQREYVTDLNGRLVHEQTPEAYASAALELLRRDPRPSADAVAATIGDRFSPARVAEGYAAAYEEARAVRASR